MKKIFLLALLLFTFLGFSQRAIIIDSDGNPIEITPIDPDPIEPDPVTTLSPPIEASEAGSTNGELSVSGTGGAMYGIPIALPPGINNVTPNIILTYNSQSGDGYAGYGWNISGISKISRVSSTLYHDGIIDPVDYDQLDRFALDGQRLILKTGVYGQFGSTYETENFSNLKISFLSYSSFAVFKVEYPDGSIATYGQVGSQVNYSIVNWINPQGLTINYEYYPYGFLLENVELIKSITYGNTITTGINKIEFLYKDKNRQDKYYVSGIEQKRNKVLSSIKVTGNGVPFRNYYLTHDLTSTGYERLKSIQEKNGDNTKSLKPITFSYKVNQSGFSQQISYSRKGWGFYYNNVLNGRYSMGDFDGDGEIEFATEDNGYFKIVDSDLSTAPSNTLYIDDVTENLSVYTAKTFNDKRTNKDYIIHSNYNWANPSLNGGQLSSFENGVLNTSPYKFYQSFGTGDLPTDSDKHYWLLLKDFGKRHVNRFVGDFDGDNNTDFLNVTNLNTGLSNLYLCKIKPNQDNFSESVGTLNTGISTYSFSPAEYNGNLSISGTSIINSGDFNGDGKTDLIVFKGSPYNMIEIYSLESNVFQLINSYNYNLPSDIGDEFKRTGRIPGNVKFKVFISDFNNDGKSDVFFPSDAKILYSTGNGFKIELLPNMIKPSATYTEAYYIGDFDNNKINNIIKIKPILENTSSTSYIWTQVGTSANGQPIYQSFPHYGYDYNYGITLDLFSKDQNINQWNLTSYSEILKREFGGTDTNPLNDNKFIERMLPLYIKKMEGQLFSEFAIMGTMGNSLFKFKRHSDDQTLLTSVNQGNGIIHEISYNNLIDGNGTYTTTTSQEAYPYYNLLNGKENKVVSGIRQISSFTKKKLYKYHGAIFDLSGRGISGFQATTVTNWFNDPSTIVSTINKFDFSKNGAIKETFSKLGLIEPNYTLLPSDDYIARSINTYNNEDTSYINPLLSNKVFKLFKTKSENFNGQNNTSSITTVNYNTYNNPINSTTIIKNGGIIEKTTTNNFGYDGVLTTPYIVDRLNNKVSTTTLATGDVHSSEEQYVYDINLLKQIKRRSTNSGLTSDFITENNEYDVYGNVIQKKYSAPGMADRVVNYEYDDATHRFLVKKIDPELQQTVYTYNQSTGLLLTETLPSIAGFPLITNYTYDSWGKVITVKDYLNKYVSYNYFNISGGGILKTSSSTDGSMSKVIYDPLGRILHEGYKNLNREYTLKSTEYNIYDQPLKVYKSYIDGNTPEVWDELQYDVYGRLTQANHLKSLSSPGKSVTYNYNGLTTTENDGLKIKTTINNASGQVISLNDNPGETITYDYFANGNLRKAYLNGGVLEIQQDAFGRRKTLIDPSAGTRNYEYNKFGELIKEEVVGKGVTEFDLDSNGKL